MNKDLQRKLNKFKSIKASQDWKADLKSELFPEEETHFLLDVLQPKLAFGSLAMTGLILALVIVGTANDYPKVPMTQNKITPRAMEIVENMQKENKDESQNEIGMMAINNEEEAETQTMTADIDIDSLSEEEKRELVRKSTEELLAELDEVEKRIVKVMGSRD